MQMDLGLKRISFSKCEESEMFHRMPTDAFPKLDKGGG